MFCAISGQPPKEPVVSKLTGHVYERSLVEKHIDAQGTCPVTGEAMSTDDVVAVQGCASNKPRETEGTSLPGLLGLFQNEWDSLMLETHTLRKHMDTLRQELSETLYQHDAACRVIARLINERDTARTELATLKAQGGVAAAPAAAPAADSMDVDQPQSGLAPQIVKALVSKSQQLSKERKKREVSSDLATVDDVKAYKQTSTHPIHKTNPAGVLCVKIDPKDNTKALTGGVDKSVILFNNKAGKVASTLTGHTKKVLACDVHSTKDVLFSCSADKTCRIWTPSNKGYEAAHVLKTHTAEVTGLSLHATGDYFVTSSLDKTWAMHDIETGRSVVSVQQDDITSGYTCINFHPDGLILGAGTEDSMCRIFDVKEQKNIATFEGHQGKLSSLAFSENGYYLATAAADSTVKLWDLRKLKNFQTISLDDGAVVNSLCWDYSGSYLAVAGTDVRVYQNKTWNLLKTFTDHGNSVATGVDFGTNAKCIATSGMDRNLKFYGSA